jgi:hypothetical protein
VPSPGANEAVLHAETTIAEIGEELVRRLRSELATINTEHVTLSEAIAAAAGDDERLAEALTKSISLPARSVTLRNLLSAAKLLRAAEQRPATACDRRETSEIAGRVAKSGRYATPPPPLDNTL